MVTRPPRPTGAWAAKNWDRKYGGVQAPKVEPATTPATTPTPTPTYTTAPSGGKGVGQTGVTGASGVGAAPAEVAVLPTWETPSTPATEAASSTAVQASQPVDFWKAAVTTEGRQSQTADPKQDPRVAGGTHYVGFGGAILPYSQNYQSADLGGITTGNQEYDALTAAQKYDMSNRYGELGGVEGINRGFSKHNASKAAQQLKQAQGQQAYRDAMSGNWSPERQGVVDDLYNSGQITYDEYLEGAHDMRSDGQGGLESLGNTRVGYRPDGTYGWMDQRDYPGWTQDMGQEMFAPRREDLNAATAQGWDVSNMGRDQAAQIAQQGAQMPQWGQPQQQQMPQWGSAPPGTMAHQYGWGAGLGGPPQQQMMPQWGQPQQMQMPQWGQRQGMGGGMQGMGMPQWGGQPQQQAMPQWGDYMMGQSQFGGAGMAAARRDGGAMPQMGGGQQPWTSMWGDPFAERSMLNSDMNRQGGRGLQGGDPMMAMMSGGGIAGGGMGGGSGYAGGGGNYDSLANILALFAGGGYGGGGGGMGGYSPMYGGLPRNGLYYADLMGG